MVAKKKEFSFRENSHVLKIEKLPKGVLHQILVQVEHKCINIYKLNLKQIKNLSQVRRALLKGCPEMSQSLFLLLLLICYICECGYYCYLMAHNWQN